MSLTMPRPVCHKFEELSDSFGSIDGERVGDWIRIALMPDLPFATDAVLDSEWLLEWKGWDDIKLMLSTTDATLSELGPYMRGLLEIAGDNEATPYVSDPRKALQLDKVGLKIGKSLVHGRDDCLADSLLQAMVLLYSLMIISLAER